MISLKEAIRARQNYVPVDLSNDKISHNVVSGSLWSGMDAGVNAFVGFVRSVILARLLAPSDFGIIAIAAVFTQFVLIFANFGFTASAIYYRDLTTEDIATCWWGNFIVDSTATLICVVCALLSTHFVETPQTPFIIIILSTQFFFHSLSSINMALLQRLFKFKLMTIISITSGIISFLLTLVFVMFFELGVYGIALGTVSGTIYSTILYFIYLPWLPSLNISLKTAKKHLSYGGWFLGVSVISYANENVDRTVVGGLLDNTQLGYFEYAARFPSIVIFELGTILNRVLFSAFSSLQSNLDELNALLEKLFRYNTILVYPMLFGLAAVSRDFTFVFYGERWEPIIFPMQILCVYGAIRVFSYPLHSLANGIGKSNMPFKWAAIGLPLNFVVTYFLVDAYKLEGVSVSKVVLALYLLLTLGIEIGLKIRASFTTIALQAFPALFCVAIMVACIKSLKFFILDASVPLAYSLFIQVSVGVIVYVGALWLFFSKDMKQLLSVILKKKVDAPSHL